MIGTTNNAGPGSSYYGSNTSNYIMAQRLGGVCHGTLWQIRDVPSGSYNSNTTTSTSTSITTTTSTTSSWFGGTVTEKMYTYCVLVGTCFITYESYTAYERGDMPYSTMTIVGASAGSFKINNATAIRRLVQSTTSKANAGSATATAATNPTATIDFRIVSDQGTHIHCQTCTSTCRMIWLAAFQSSIEDALLEQTITTTSSRHSRMIPPPIPDICTTETTSAGSNNKLSTARLFRSLSITTTKLPRYCVSCGAVEIGTAAGMSLTSSVSSPPTSGNLRKPSVRKELASAVAEGMRGSNTTSHAEEEIIDTTDNDTSSRVLKLPSSSSPGVVVSPVQTRMVGTLGTQFSTPLTQYGKELRCDVCFHCSIAQGLVDYMEFCSSLLEYRIREKKTLQLASKICWKAIYDTSAALNIQQQKQQQEKQAIEKDKPAATPTESEDANNDAVEKVSDDDKKVDKSVENEEDDNESNKETAFPPSFEEYFNMRWQHRIPENTTTVLTALMKLSTEFASYRKQSTMLQSLYNDFFDGRGDNGSCISVVEFLESLDELAEYSKNAEKDAIAQLKKEAFRIAGDMGTAMKLFLELALTGPERGRDHNSMHSIVPIDADKFTNTGSMSPTSTASSPKYSIGGGNRNSSNQHLLHRLVSNINPYDTEMLICVLEFFLDLCERGDLATVAFFWPQICHIHLRMLPAKNAMELARIDLVEDFLLTVSTQYSIHLALDLTWMHTADLEESLLLSSGLTNPQVISNSSVSSGTNSTITATGDGTSVLPKCRQRRFAVLRFLCELESMLFDETGTRWGCASTTTRRFVGGSGVALGSMLSPTPHQAELLQQAAANIQALRNQIIQSTAEDTDSSEHNFQGTLRAATSWYEKKRKSMQSLPPEQLAAEKLRFARNADYYTCHLNFSKRLSDIAEKLRHCEIETRSGLLQQELELLNTSGLMGGDPLNRILTDGFIRALRIPATEGHVFRSKERTPVLLLMEVVDESAEQNDEIDNVNQSSNQKEQAIEASNGTKIAVPETDSINPDPSNDNDEEEIETLKVDLVDESVTRKSRSLGRRQQSSSIFEDNSVNNDGQSSSPQHLFHSQGSSDVQSVTRQRTPSDMSDILEGASSGSRPSPRPGALKRFDDMRPLTPKSDVQCLVHAVVEHQLNELSMPNLSMLTPERREHEKRELVFNQGYQANKSIDKLKDLKDFEDNKSSHRLSGGTVPTSASSIDLPRTTKKLSTLSGQNFESGDSSAALFAPTGDVRREVLTTIMMRGIQGNSIAAGAADSVQRTLKELGRKRATELLLKDDDDVPNPSPEKDKTDTQSSDTPTTRQKMESLGLSPVASLEDEELAARPTEEDEIMEAIRLILIQNRVAQGKLSPADAAKVLQYSSLSPSNYSSTSRGRSVNANGTSPTFDASDHPTIDAGDVDPRLVGCGPLPPAILQAMTLWKAEMVTNAELLELVKKDVEFVKHSVLVDSESINALKENSAFWGRFAFGERWAEKKSRIASTSPVGSVPGWDLLGVIVKSNDDLRQEAFIMQLIELCKEAFELAGLELWISPYRILATGRTTGVIECVRNAMSFDALKKRPGYGKGGLREHLLRMTEFTADPGEAFKTAQRNFVRSLAAYSLLSYFFMFKDRHNGNLLLDTAGHVIHIDFGFVFGIAPGGSFSLEMSTPFKLTEEMLDVMGGLRSPLFSEFVTLFCCGFLTLQSYCDTFLTIVEITCTDSTFKCFDSRDTNEIVAKLRERFCPDLNKEETVTYALDLIKQATTSYGTRQYDIFQYLSQGIVA